MAGEPQFDVAVAHEYFSADCFNKAWDYLDQAERSSEDDQRMIETSLASVWHWTQREDCTDTNLSIGYWQASRVYATARVGAEAYRYGELCLKVSQAQGVPPFYLGYAYEALARAALVMGDRQRMAAHLSKARRVAETVPDPEARKGLIADLQNLDWGRRSYSRSPVHRSSLCPFRVWRIETRGDDMRDAEMRACNRSHGTREITGADRSSYRTLRTHVLHRRHKEIAMRQGRLGKLAPLLGLLFLVACPVVAQPSGGALHVLHESLGEVIDAEENARYNIFGEVAGFTAARIHQVGTGDLELHLLRNAEGRAQIAIIRLPLHGDPGYSTMRSIVANRIGAARTEAVQFDTAIYPVRESSWAERSVNKKLLLRDGSQLIVTFKRAQGDTLFVQTAGGLQIPVPDINIAKVIDLRGEIIEGRFVRTDPNTSRLLFAPTGRQLSSGTGYFADYYVFFPTLAFGVTDFLALSGGMSLLPGLDSQLLYFAPKLTLRPSPNTGLAMGFLYLAIPEDEDDLNLGYVVTTLGGDRGGTTIGVGLPLSSDTDRDPIFLIGGEAQISNSAKLITENWIFTGGDDFTLFSGGIRFFGDKLAVDLALITAKEAWEEDGFPFAPWVDFSVFFGR